MKKCVKELADTCLRGIVPRRVPPSRRQPCMTNVTRRRAVNDSGHVIAHTDREKREKFRRTHIRITTRNYEVPILDPFI